MQIKTKLKSILDRDGFLRVRNVLNFNKDLNLRKRRNTKVMLTNQISQKLQNMVNEQKRRDQYEFDNEFLDKFKS